MSSTLLTNILEVVNMSKKPKLGSGERFAKLKKSLAAKGDVDNPGAVAASIGREKYGKKRFQKLAAKGKKGY